MIGMGRKVRGLVLLLNLHPSGLVGQGTATELRGVQMGMEVRIVGHGPAGAVRDAAALALARIDSLEWVFSDWRPGSELSRVGHHPAGTWVTISPGLFSVIARALEVAAATDGAFDPTVGPLTQLWRESRRSGEPIAAAALAEARSRTGWPLVSLDTARSAIRFARDGMRLDLGAIAKGWILAEAREVMQEHGIDAVLIEAGGDLVVGAAPPGQPGWRVAVRTSQGDSVVVVSDAAIATSGPDAQWIVDSHGVRHSHVIDPGRGRGITASTTITVIGRDPAMTDALATALTLVPPADRAALARQFGVALVSAVGSW